VARNQVKRHNAGMIKSLLSMIDSATEDTSNIPVEAENHLKKPVGLTIPGYNLAVRTAPRHLESLKTEVACSAQLAIGIMAMWLKSNTLQTSAERHEYVFHHAIRPPQHETGVASK
jgi:hypothetical protein